MVQSITDKSSLISTEKKVADLFADNDANNFENVLGEAQSKFNENETNTATSTADNKANKDLVEEFKAACMGFSFCGKCGAMYRGTAVAKCSKCGHDMKEDNENAKKLSGANTASESSTASTSSTTTQSTAKI